MRFGHIFHFVSVATCAAIFSLHPAQAQTAPLGEASKATLVTAINRYAEIRSRDEITKEQILQATSDFCAAMGQLIKSGDLDRMNATSRRVYEETREAQEVILVDGQRFGTFIEEEVKVLVDFGLTERAVYLTLQLVTERRGRLAASESSPEVATESVSQTFSIACTGQFIEANERVEKRDLGWLWGAGKLIVGLGLIGADASAFVTISGFGAPLAAASSSFGGMMAKDGYNDLTALW